MIGEVIKNDTTLKYPTISTPIKQVKYGINYKAKKLDTIIKVHEKHKDLVNIFDSSSIYSYHCDSISFEDLIVDTTKLDLVWHSTAIVNWNGDAMAFSGDTLIIHDTGLVRITYTGALIKITRKQ